MVDRLLAALNDRIWQFMESGDPSVVLDPAALEEARRLREASRPQTVICGQFPSMSSRSWHICTWPATRCCLRGRTKLDLKIALSYFSLLAERAPERVPGHIWESLARPGQKGPAMQGDSSQRVPGPGAVSAGRPRRVPGRGGGSFPFGGGRHPAWSPELGRALVGLGDLPC